MNCWGHRYTDNPQRKGCCYHACSQCPCDGCINKFDVDTHLAMLRAKRYTYHGCPCHACCCCCKCTGRVQRKYLRPPWLEYEDDPFKAYQGKLVEYQAELKRREEALMRRFDDDEEGRQGRRKKKKKKKQEKETAAVEGGVDEGDLVLQSIDTGQDKG